VRKIAAALLAGLVTTSLSAQPPDRTPLERYFIAVNADFAAWDISGSGGNLSHTQGLFDQAMAAAPNGVQRQALVLHWEKVKQCLGKRLPAANRDYRKQVVEECKEEAGDKAAAVKAAAYAQ